MHKALLCDGAITLYGNGQEVRDYINVEDAANALIILSSHAGEIVPVYNLCSAQGISIKNLSAMIVKMSAQDTDRIIFSGNPKPGDPRRWVGCNKLLLASGYTPNYSLERGLRQTLDWFRSSHTL